MDDADKEAIADYIETQTAVYALTDRNVATLNAFLMPDNVIVVLNSAYICQCMLPELPHSRLHTK